MEPKGARTDHGIPRMNDEASPGMVMALPLAGTALESQRAGTHRGG
jgi:hypothetical protein